jgi:hypothetical protein
MIHLKKKTNTKLRWAYRFLKRNGFSIRRITHLGQIIPTDNNDIKTKFIADIIKARKDLDISFNDNSRIINMDETPCFIDMYYDTTIDFTGNKHIEIQTLGKEKYRLSVILSISGDGIKLPAFFSIKGEEGKTIEKQMNDLYYVINKEMYIHCQPQGWCTTELFCM